MKVLMVIFLTAVVMLAFAHRHSGNPRGHSGERGGHSGERGGRRCLNQVCSNSTTCVSCVKALKLSRDVINGCLGSNCTNAATASICITAAKSNTCFTAAG